MATWTAASSALSRRISPQEAQPLRTLEDGERERALREGRTALEVKRRVRLFLSAYSCARSAAYVRQRPSTLQLLRACVVDPGGGRRARKPCSNRGGPWTLRTLEAIFSGRSHLPDPRLRAEDTALRSMALISPRVRRVAVRYGEPASQYVLSRDSYVLPYAVTW